MRKLRMDRVGGATPPPEPDRAGRPARPPVSRTRMLVSVLAPVVGAAAVAAAVLPRALSARDASDRPAAAALTGANLPSGVVAALDGPPAEPPAPRTRVRPTPSPVTITIDAVAPGPAVDGAAGTAAVDPAAVQAEVSAVLAGTGVAATDGSTGIPVTVLAAYQKAETLLAAAKPSCHLPWWVLAGIGKVESDHASGGRVDANGTTRGRIVGIALDGSVPGTAVIPDSDGGSWDGDAAFDRAVGPMQFLPGSWRAWGKDGNGDGVADPNNVFDAATGAGYLLCSAGDLSDPANLSRAILLYNHSASYVAAVLRWGTAYRDGATPSPDSAASVPTTPVQKDTSPPSATPAAPSSAVEAPGTAPEPGPTPSTSATSPPAGPTTTTTQPPTTTTSTTSTTPTTTTNPPTTTTTSATVATTPTTPATSTTATTSTRRTMPPTTTPTTTP